MCKENLRVDKRVINKQRIVKDTTENRHRKMKENVCIIHTLRDIRVKKYASIERTHRALSSPTLQA